MSDYPADRFRDTPLDQLWAEFETKLKSFQFASNSHHFDPAYSGQGTSTINLPEERSVWLDDIPPWMSHVAPKDLNQTIPMEPGESVDDYYVRVRRASFKLIKGDK